MTADSLNNYSCKDLAEMAKSRGVRGWHSMRKDQLVRALVRLGRAKSRAAAARKSTAAPRNGRSSRAAVAVTARAERPSGTNLQAARATAVGARTTTNGRGTTNGRAATTTRTVAAPRKAAVRRKLSPVASRKLEQAKRKHEQLKSLASTNGRDDHAIKDRLVVMVRDPFWLHAYWELSRQGVARAEAAMGQDWHAARPILRLYEVAGGSTTSSVETLRRDIEIHGGVSNWYVDVPDPPKSYRLDIGYRAPSGKFFVLARSNVVSTPKPGSRDTIDENWADVAENFERIYALSGGYSQEGCAEELQELFEERLRRPMGSPFVSRFAGDGLVPRRRHFNFEIDAELIVYGKSEPDAHVTLQGEPVKLRPDGTFTMRFSMPNSRQVIPAVAASADGAEQRTIVLAIERNTKFMEPLVRGDND